MKLVSDFGTVAAQQPPVGDDPNPETGADPSDPLVPELVVPAAVDLSARPLGDGHAGRAS